MTDLQKTLLDLLGDNTLQWAMLLGGMVLLTRLRGAQPARLGFVLILLPVPLLLLGFWWPWVRGVFSVYTPLLMLAMLADGLWATPTPQQLSLSRMTARKWSIGQPAVVQLTLLNNSSQALLLQWRDGVPSALQGEPLSGTRPVGAGQLSLPAFGRETVQYTLTPTRRGVYSLGRIHARYRSRWGLLWLTLQGGRSETIQVVPDLRRIQRMRIRASQAVNAGELQRRSLGLEGTQFSGLRHYFAGDDVRKMAWQATAKLDVPVVRTYEHEVEQPILVLLDAGRKMQAPLGRLQKYDWALNTALAFMAVAIDRNDSVGASVFSNRLLVNIPVSSGRPHLNQLMERLGQTEPEAKEPDYETVFRQVAQGLKRRSLVVVLTDLIDPMASRNLVRALKHFRTLHRVMVVALSDSKTLAQAAQMPEEPYEAYAKGVALDWLALRRQALTALAHAGNVTVIDAPPEQLDEALIDRYLTLKQRSQL